jgi:hypothetical protein
VESLSDKFVRAENERVRGSFSAFAQFAAGASRSRGATREKRIAQHSAVGVFPQPMARIQFRFLVLRFLRAYDSVAISRSCVMNCCGRNQMGGVS